MQIRALLIEPEIAYSMRFKGGYTVEWLLYDMNKPLRQKIEISDMPIKENDQGFQRIESENAQ